MSGEAKEWYAQAMGSLIGPMTGSQLRAMAERGQLTAETSVRHGANGQWVAAVNGLMPARQTPPPQVAAPTSRPVASRPAVPEPVENSQGSWIDIFDFSFQRYVTPSIITVTWCLCLGAAVLYILAATYQWLIGPIFGPRVTPSANLSPEDSLKAMQASLETWSTILSVIRWFMLAVALLWARVVLESVAVFFNVARSLSSIDGKIKG